MVGDMIALDNLPGVAQVAIQGAKYAAKEIQQPARGQAAAGAVQVLRQGLDGDHQPLPRGRDGRQAPAHRLHRLADVARRAPRLHHRLQEPGHRAAALGVTFLGRGRSERTTTEQQIFARAALARLRRGAADLVSDPGAYDAARTMLEETRAPSWRRAAPRRPGSPTPVRAASRPTASAAPEPGRTTTVGKIGLHMAGRSSPLS